MAAICSPSTRAATRSRCSASGPRLSARVEGGTVWSGGFEPISVTVSGGLVYVANEGNKTTGAGSNYTGFTLNPGGHLAPISGSTFALSNSANPGDILFIRPAPTWSESRSAPRTPTRSSSTAHGRIGWAPDAAAGSPFAARPRAVRQRVSHREPVPPVRLQRARGSGNGSVSAFNVSSAALSARSRLALPRQPDGPVLGRDHPRRELPVHGEHRQHQHLDLPDRGERLAALGGQHAVQERARNPAFDARLDPATTTSTSSTRSSTPSAHLRSRAPA